ncbi:hypothetical protein [Pseudomonas aeruginosa]|uniref:hypothetical protein n=1 Tax=Pseudomonas aeruginosa TaxID=287 RepID=UPI000A774D47
MAVARQPRPPSPPAEPVIHDGSLFPTSIGANPQLSVYGLTAAKLASALAERLARA